MARSWSTCSPHPSSTCRPTSRAAAWPQSGMASGTGPAGPAARGWTVSWPCWSARSRTGCRAAITRSWSAACITSTSATTAPPRWCTGAGPTCRSQGRSWRAPRFVRPKKDIEPNGPWRYLPGHPLAGAGRRSAGAARVAAAEAVGGAGGDHHVVVAVPIGRPADGGGAARFHRDRLGAALVVVRGQGVADRLLALVGQRELDHRPAWPGPRGGGDDRDRAAVLAGRHHPAGEAGQEAVGTVDREGVPPGGQHRV